MKVNCLHVAVNCNPITNSIITKNNYIMYASSDQIQIYNIEEKKIVKSLFIANVNNVRTNVIKFAINKIVAGYASGNLIVYKDELFENKINLGSSIIDIIYIQTKKLYIVLTINCQICQIDQQLNLLKKIVFPKNKIQQHIQQIYWNNKSYIFLGGVDNLIHIYDSNLQYYDSLKGHQTSITKLSYNPTLNILASADRNGKIRLWKISTQYNSKDQIQKNHYQIEQNMHITLQSIVFHQNSVTGLTWKQQTLFSCSLDCTIQQWTKNISNLEQVWIGIKTAYLGNNKNSFFSIASHKYVIAITYTGSLYIMDGHQIIPGITGHHNQCTSLAWSSRGQFLISSSKDQTTRIYAECKKNWHEFSRVQNHGYQINDVCFLYVKNKYKKNNICDLVISAADEKVIRVYEPPSQFINFINKFTEYQLRLFFQNEQQQQKFIQTNQPLQYKCVTLGQTQVLGLMTKALKNPKQKLTNYYDPQQNQQIEIQNLNQKQQIYQNQPNQLPNQPKLRFTLWPQMTKIYGHPYQLNIVRGSPCGNFIASACKSQTKQYSKILIFQKGYWKCIKQVQAHQYTVTDLIWKQNIQISVGRDRNLILYKNWQIIYINKPHTRVITSCCLSQDQRYLVSTSRDKKFIFYQLYKQYPYLKIIMQIKLKEPIFSSAIKNVGNKVILAIGLQNGEIWIYQKIGDLVLQKTVIKQQHSMRVNKLQFRPGKQFILASCSKDHSLRIFHIL